MVKTVIITHDDLDGVGAAALYLRGKGLKPYEVLIGFSKPHQIVEKLKKALKEEPEVIAVMDLGLNKDIVDEVVNIISSSNVVIEWFDHHVWDKNWIKKLKSVNVRLYVDNSTCATGVVAKYLGLNDEFSLKLVGVICAIDLWRWDNPLAPFMYRIGMWVDEKQESLLKLVAFFASGKLWDKDFDEIVEEYVNKELKNYKKIDRIVEVMDIDDCRVVLAVKYWDGPPHRSLLAQYLIARYNADVAIILRPWGGISLRSRTVDVRSIALELGGGGHPRASGAPLNASWLRKIFARIYPRILYGPVKRRVVAAIMKTGCKYIGGEGESQGDYTQA